MADTVSAATGRLGGGGGIWDQVVRRRPRPPCPLASAGTARGGGYDGGRARPGCTFVLFVAIYLCARVGRGGGGTPTTVHRDRHPPPPP